MGVRARVSRCSLQRRPRRDGEEAYLGVDWLRAPLVGSNWLYELSVAVNLKVCCALGDGLKISFLTQREGDPRQRRRPERWFHWHHVRGGFIGARHGPSDLAIPLPRRPFHFAAPGRGARYDYHPRAPFFVEVPG